MSILQRNYYAHTFVLTQKIGNAATDGILDPRRSRFVLTQKIGNAATALTFCSSKGNIRMTTACRETYISVWRAFNGFF